MDRSGTTKKESHRVKTPDAQVTYRVSRTKPVIKAPISAIETTI